MTNDEHSRHALDNTRHSTGIFRSSGLSGNRGICFFYGGSTVTLFTYGVGDFLPDEAGYFGAVTARGETNCSKYGSLVDPGSGYGFVIRGAAARIGRTRIYDPAGQTDIDYYPSWLDALDMRIREALAENISMELNYDGKMMRYTLGSLLARPLMNSIYGPSVTLDTDKESLSRTPGPVGTWRHDGHWTCGCESGHVHKEEAVRCGQCDAVRPSVDDKEFAEPDRSDDPMKPFWPFRRAAYSAHAVDDKVTVKMVMNKNVAFDVPAAVHTSKPLECIAVPVRVWLFGETVAIPSEPTCSLPQLFLISQVMPIDKPIGPVCHGCNEEIEPEICHCGESVDNHNADHSFVPMGCNCHNNKEPLPF